jgi:hypothetical protein
MWSFHPDGGCVPTGDAHAATQGQQEPNCQVPLGASEAQDLLMWYLPNSQDSGTRGREAQCLQVT